MKEPNEITITMSASGGMKWSTPKDAKEVTRHEVYTLLGLTRYAESVLLKMLETPAKE
jgi:hypothetical protein